MTALAAALQARALQVRLGDRQVLHGLSLALPAGRWTAIVGPNGAGKSTLLRALAGMESGAGVQGEVELLGRPLRQWSARKRACSLAWLGQNQPVAGDMQVFSDLQVGDDIIVQRAAFTTTFLHPPGYSYFATLRGKLNWHELPHLQTIQR